MIEAAPLEECKMTVFSPVTLSDSSSSVVRENAKYFVYGFYSKFNYDPLHVVEYYAPDAVSIYENQQYNGQDEIRQLLTNIKDQSPEVEIRELNAIRSVESTTQIHLIGEFKCGDKRTFRRFTQSLVLIGDQADNFRIASDITSFAFQIRGIAKKRSRNTLGGFKVMDTSSGSQESDQVRRQGKFPKSARTGRKRYFKRKNGKKAAPKVEVKIECHESTKPDVVKNQQKVKVESSNTLPKSEGTLPNSVVNTGTTSSSVVSVKKEENGKTVNSDGNTRGTFKQRKRWQNGKGKAMKKSKVTLPLVYSSPSTSY
ncbi:unnamed protein product [Hymenolepis diminuta]|uniref:NTF2 domain-containing protein n=1 Tax=Hymenolepis diminuta TaxID=6216 RepID=A0A0R3SRI0_HYMDI|nr:unnamed protein product [Hymenolepis diminuta]VUZ56557.1 unnamed protein product [Hymenolepis diminuta]